tara:strand:+ start:1258 stop:2142 length:885 start_codon:yes stop_codon:yes gene_type:complete
MILHYDEIVIGSSLRAVMFAFIRKLPIFFTKDTFILFKFDYLLPTIDLSFLGLQPKEKVLKTFGSIPPIGIPKLLLWERLIFLMSLEGLCPLSNLCNSMSLRLETIVCSNEYSKIAEIAFNKCFYFGDKGFNLHQSEEKIYTCYDWIAFNRGGKHEIDYIKTDDDFVRHIWFYPSERIDGNTRVRDACAVSFLTQTQLDDFDYSQTMARFKAVHEMERRGMKGLRNGIGPDGRPKYYKFRTSAIKREKTNAKFKRFKDEKCRFSFPKSMEKTLLKNLSNTDLGNYRFLKVVECI